MSSVLHGVCACLGHGAGSTPTLMEVRPGARSSFARRGRAAIVAAALGCAGLALVATAGDARAQSRNQFGRADRASAAGDLITLSVQQAISQLPPTAGQSFTYAFDPATDTFEPSERQGPTVLVSPRTIGEGMFAARLGVSYFQLQESFDPVFYRIRGPNDADGNDPLVAKFGLNLGANVTLIDLTATYGVAAWLDVFLDLPIVIVDADASQTYVERGQGALFVGGNRALVDRAEEISVFQQSLGLRGTFNEGTNVGVGRIGVGARTPFYANEFMEVGLVTRFSFASPTPDDYSGSDSYAIYPRVVAELFSDQVAQLYADVGYEYDFSIAELRRFAWSTGASMPFSKGSIDVGVSGSIYDTPVRWTPDTATGDPVGDDRFRDGLLFEIDDPSTNTVDTDVVNLLLGGKFQIWDNTMLAGSLLIALTDNGIRPDVAGTLSIEVYL